MTSSTPLTANAALDAAKTAADRALAEAKAKQKANGDRAVQKLMALAARSPSKRAGKLTAIANAIKQRTSIAGDPFAAMLGEMEGAYAITAQQFFDFEANNNAYEILVNTANAVDALAGKLGAAGNTNLANAGLSISAACDALLDVQKNYPEKNIGSQVNVLVENARAWTAQAETALAEAATTPPETPPPLEEPVGTPAGGGGGAPDGGGGAPDGGGGEAVPEEAAPEEAEAPAEGSASGLEFGGQGGSIEEETVEEAVEEIPGYVDEATVKAVQQALIAKGYGLAVDGIFNDATAAAVGQFQAAEGMQETGVIDDDVLAALGVQIPAPPSAASEGDLFSAIVGELEGRKIVGTAVKVPIKVVPKSPAVPASSLKEWLKKPMWTGSKVLIWHGAVGAGVAVTLSGIAIAVLRRK